MSAFAINSSSFSISETTFVVCALIATFSSSNFAFFSFSLRNSSASFSNCAWSSITSTIIESLLTCVVSLSRALEEECVSYKTCVRGGVYSKCGITQKIMKEEKAQRERES